MKRTMFCSALALILTFGFGTTAQAQLGGVLNRARNRVQQAAQQTAQDARQSVEDATVGTVRQAGERVQQQAQQTVNNAVDATVGQAQRTVNGAVNQATSTVNNAVNGVVDATVGQAQRTVNGVVNQATGTVNNAVNGVVDATVGQAQRTVNGVVDQATGTVNNAVDGAIDATVGQASRTAQSAMQRVTNRIQGLTDAAVDGTVGAASRAVDGAVQRVTQPVIGTIDGITNSATGAVNTAVNGVYESVMARVPQGRSGKQSTSYGSLPTKFKPSKKAKQEDPAASYENVEEGYTKSISAIHGGYEGLDAKLYPYQPYYNYPAYYVMHRSRSMKDLDNDYMQVMNCAFQLAGTDRTMTLLSARKVTIPKQREGYVFFDETFRNAYTALFVCDPMSTAAFGRFTRTLLLDDARVCGGVHYAMDNPEQAIMSEADNAVLAYKNYNDFLKMRSNRRDQALCVARSTTPINVIRNSIDQWIDSIYVVDNARDRFLYYWLANEAYEEVLIHHDKYVGGDDANLALGKKLNEAREIYSDIIAEGELERMEGQDMPATYNVKGVNAAKLEAALKANLGEEWEIVQVVQLGNAWKTSTKQRTLPVGAVVKVGKFRFLFPRTLTEAKKGRNWSGTYTISGDDLPVKLNE